MHYLVPDFFLNGIVYDLMFKFLYATFCMILPSVSGVFSVENKEQFELPDKDIIHFATNTTMSLYSNIYIQVTRGLTKHVEGG